jgi:transposase
VLFLGRGSPHTAAVSQALADELDIELRWLPTACPELNPVESLWRWLKGRILCNHQPDNIEDTTQTALEAIDRLTLRQTLNLAGTLSKDFLIALWLMDRTRS